MFTTFAEFARFLNTRENEGDSAILFLGSRTGGLFDNHFLYDLLKGFSLKNLENLSEVEIFHECYDFMKNSLNEREINKILILALQSMKGRKEDTILAELIEAKIFDIIITTNIDTLLEDAFERLKIKKPWIIDGYTESNFHLEAKESLIVKVFGERDTSNYRIPGKARNLDVNWHLQSFLTSKFSENVLVIGYDPVWDGAIEHLFPDTGGKITYVNEELPPEDSYMNQVIKRREGQYLVGSSGNYRQFMKQYKKMLELKELRDLFGFEHNGDDNRVRPAISDTNNGKPITLSEKSLSIIDKERTQGNTHSQSTLEINSRKTIFISYSHLDKRFLEYLLPYLTYYKRVGNIDCWSDKDIEVGTNWQEKIMQALEAAQGAILLISQHFLSSQFITEIELPPLLIAARNKGAVIIPVILRKCAIDDTPLNQFQVINPEKPVNKMKPYERDEIWVKITKRLKDS